MPSISVPTANVILPSISRNRDMTTLRSLSFCLAASFGRLLWTCGGGRWFGMYLGLVGVKTCQEFIDF